VLAPRSSVFRGRSRTDRVALVHSEPHVVVLGAGFGGVAAAEVLAEAPVRTTLVDVRYYNTFQPLLYQVATGGLNAGDIAYPLRNLLRTRPRLDFRCARVEGVDFAGKTVLLGDGGTLPYDSLVVATGAATNFFGVPGATEHSRAIYTLDDALAVRAEMFGQLEKADAAALGGGTPAVVVVGGGPTGVETAGALAELHAMAFGKVYRSLDPAMSRVVLVERRDGLLAGFDPRLSRYAAAELRRRGVEVRLGLAVEEVGAGAVRLRDLATGTEQQLACGLVVWAAGVGAGDVVGSLPPTLVDGGRLRVEPTLLVAGLGDDFAVGDAAAAPGPDGRPLPQLAQPAIQGGRHAAAQILRALEGRPPLPFSYRDKGIMATIGRHAAVAEVRVPALGGRAVRLRGRTAWLAWLGLHIVALLGGRNRSAVLLNWAWRYVAWRRGPRVIVGG
jgi:NADH:ubiquinone reductase (H+-translocating)